jgi:hypothetical protein
MSDGMRPEAQTCLDIVDIVRVADEASAAVREKSGNFGFTFGRRYHQHYRGTGQGREFQMAE